MPEISRFYGIVITMYYGDHAPPHFHARYGGARAAVDIHTLTVIAGALPPRVLGHVVECGAFVAPSSSPTGGRRRTRSPSTGSRRWSDAMTLPDVVAVTPLPNHRLRLRFDDGVEGEVDVAAIVAFTGVFEPLADPSYFERVEVAEEAGTVVWPSGADLDPLVLYAHATGRSVEDLLAAEDALTG